MVLFTKEMTTGVLLRDVLAFVVAYVFGLSFLPHATFFELVNGILFGVCIAVSILFFPSIPGFLRHGPTGIAMMRIGIAGAWLVQAIQSIGRIYFLEFRPEVQGRTFDAYYGLPAAFYIIFAMCHIVAIGMVDNTPVRRNICIGVWSGLAGLFAAAATIVWHHGLLF